VSRSSTAQYGARAGAVGLAGAVDGEEVGDGTGDCVGDGLGVGVAITLELDGVLIVGTGVDVEETGGGAHVNASHAATARRSGAVDSRRGHMFADGDRDAF